MSNEQAQMLAAAEAIDSALQRLAIAYHDYVAAYHVTSRAAYSHPRNHRQETLAQGVGIDRLDILMAARMRALGLGSVLGSARADTTTPDLSALTSKIRALVP